MIHVAERRRGRRRTRSTKKTAIRVVNIFHPPKTYWRKYKREEKKTERRTRMEKQ